MKLKDRINYRLLCGVIYPLSLLPLGVLYGLADVTAWLARVVVRYRRKVIMDNLRHAFPDRSEAELKRICHRFYRFLADYGVETIKLLTISRSRMMRRMHMEGADELAGHLRQGRNVILYLGHYCNWEWVSSMPIWLGDMSDNAAQAYHPLSNKGMDRLFINIRTRFGAHNLPMNDMMRFLIERRRKGLPTITGLIADQSPSLNHHLFAEFFHRETGWYTGPERIARFQNAVVYYVHMSRPKRGYYTARFELMTDSPKKEPTFEITRDFIRRLEANISEAPGYYLWSHRRWKRTREDFDRYWGDKAKEQLSHL